MELILITNDAPRALAAQNAGVDYVMIDLEINGKEARQGHLNTVISRHSLEDVDRLRQVLDRSRLLVRVNPVFDGSQQEIDSCIDLGADALMLPMFTTAMEVRRFVELVRGRAKVWLLLETPQALVRVEEIVECAGIDVVHVGLNDLHLGLGLDFMFEPLAGGVIDWVCGYMQRRGVSYGFGGVARIGGVGALDAALILSEHVRLGSSRTILSRDFQKVFELPAEEAQAKLKDEVSALRRELERLSGCSREELSRNRGKLVSTVREIASSKIHARDNLPTSKSS